MQLFFAPHANKEKDTIPADKKDYKAWHVLLLLIKAFVPEANIPGIMTITSIVLSFKGFHRGKPPYPGFQNDSHGKEESVDGILGNRSISDIISRVENNKYRMSPNYWTSVFYRKWALDFLEFVIRNPLYIDYSSRTGKKIMIGLEHDHLHMEISNRVSHPGVYLYRSGREPVIPKNPINTSWGEGSIVNLPSRGTKINPFFQKSTVIAALKGRPSNIGGRRRFGESQPQKTLDESPSTSSASPLSDQLSSKGGLETAVIGKLIDLINIDPLLRPW